MRKDYSVYNWMIVEQVLAGKTDGMKLEAAIIAAASMKVLDRKDPEHAWKAAFNRFGRIDNGMVYPKDKIVKKVKNHKRRQQSMLSVPTALENTDGTPISTKKRDEIFKLLNLKDENFKLTCENQRLEHQITIEKHKITSLEFEKTELNEENEKLELTDLELHKIIEIKEEELVAANKKTEECLNSNWQLKNLLKKFIKPMSNANEMVRDVNRVHLSNCKSCGKEIFIAFFHYHHIIPRKYGGTDNIENRIPLCSVCHDYVELKTEELQVFDLEVLKTLILNKGFE